MEPVVTTMSTILTNIGSIVTAAVDWVGTALGTVTASGNELLFVLVALPVAGFAVGLLRRMINLG